MVKNSLITVPTVDIKNTSINYLIVIFSYYRLVSHPQTDKIRYIHKPINKTNMSKTVAEVMTADPFTVKPQTPLQEAIQLMAEKHISGLPVLDDAGVLVGVISQSDLMWQETGVETPPYVMILDSVIYLSNPKRYEKEIHKALGQTVGEVMSDHAITITPDKTVQQAAQIMHDKKIKRLPVVDETQGNLIGILTRGDIIRSMAGD